MIEVIEIDDFKQAMKESYALGLRSKANARPDLGISVDDWGKLTEGDAFAQLLEILAEGMIRYSENTPYPRVYRFEDDEIKQEAIDWRGNLPKAARGDYLVSRKRLRISDIAYIGVQLSMSFLASGVATAIIEDDKEAQIAAIFVIAGNILAMAHSFAQKDRLKRDEHCLFIKASFYGASFDLTEAREWFPSGETKEDGSYEAARCDIPIKRHWQCSFRENGNCLFLENHGQQESDYDRLISVIARDLVAKKFFKESEEGKYESSFSIKGK